jgi:hypothetical protein
MGQPFAGSAAMKRQKHDAPSLHKSDELPPTLSLSPAQQPAKPLLRVITELSAAMPFASPAALSKAEEWRALDLQRAENARHAARLNTEVQAAANPNGQSSPPSVPASTQEPLEAAGNGKKPPGRPPIDPSVSRSRKAAHAALLTYCCEVLQGGHSEQIELPGSARQLAMLAADYASKGGLLDADLLSPESGLMHGLATISLAVLKQRKVVAM